MRILIMLAAAAAIAYSQERPWPKTSGYQTYLPPSWKEITAPPEDHASLPWKVSVGVFAALQAADAATSYGYPEANPIYGQRFGARGIAIKAIIAVAVPLAEHRLMRHHPNVERAFTATNFGASGATMRAVIFNARDIATTPAPIGITPGVGTVRP